MTQLHMYIYSFSYSFPLWFIPGYCIEFPVLYGGTLLCIHPLYTSVHLFIPHSQPFPSLPSSPHPSHKSVLSVRLFQDLLTSFVSAGRRPGGSQRERTCPGFIISWVRRAIRSLIPNPVLFFFFLNRIHLDLRTMLYIF